MDRHVLPESVLLAAIGLADLLATTYLLATGKAWEGNPLMAGLLMHGSVPFVLVKVLFIAGPITVAELARKRFPVTARWTLRFAIPAYLVLWTWATAVANRWL